MTWRYYSLLGGSNGSAVYFCVLGFETACNESYREFVYLD